VLSVEEGSTASLEHQTGTQDSTVLDGRQPRQLAIRAHHQDRSARGPIVHRPRGATATPPLQLCGVQIVAREVREHSQGVERNRWDLFHLLQADALAEGEAQGTRATETGEGGATAENLPRSLAKERM